MSEWVRTREMLDYAPPYAYWRAPDGGYWRVPLSLEQAIIRSHPLVVAARELKNAIEAPVTDPEQDRARVMAAEMGVVAALVEIDAALAPWEETTK